MQDKHKPTIVFLIVFTILLAQKLITTKINFKVYRPRTNVVLEPKLCMCNEKYLVNTHYTIFTQQHYNLRVYDFIGLLLTDTRRLHFLGSWFIIVLW